MRGQEGQSPTIEEVARQNGWNPEYDGPDKIDAGEYMRRKPLFDKIKTQGQELRQIRQTVDQMAQTYKAMSEAQYQRGLKDAEKRIKAAEEALDVEAYKTAVADKTALEESRTAVVEPEPPEMAEWCSRNPWFEKDPVMTADAVEYGTRFARLNPRASLAERLKYVDAKMRKDYPDAFAEPSKQPQTPMVEGGAGESPPSDPLAKLKSSMTGEEKRVMAQYIKRGNMTEKEYLESYALVRKEAK